MDRLWTAMALVVAVVASGCTHALTQPMPQLDGPLGLKVSQETASGWTDMPIGVHRIPETSVYVSGHQGAAGVGMLFGPIGLAAAHAAAQSTGEEKAGDPMALRIDIAAEADRVLKEELERRRDVARFAPPGGRADATLEVVPYIVLTFIGEDRVRPWVVLKALLPSAGGQPLRTAIDRALRAGVDVMLRDAAGQLPRGKGRMVKVKGHWVWVKPPLEINAEILEETPEMLVVKPDVSDAIVFAGISVLDPRAVSVSAGDEAK